MSHAIKWILSDNISIFLKIFMKKIAIVTGASSGIGKDTALLLSKNGFRVYAIARRIEKLKLIESENIIPVVLDITNSQNVLSSIQKLSQEIESLDLLVNNAGFGIYNSIEETNLDDARQMFETNLFGLANITNLCLPLLKKSSNPYIINISSVSGKFSNPFGGWYSATKHALEAYSDALRIELLRFKIKVVIIEPGQTNTNFGEIAFKETLKDSSKDYLESKEKFFHFLYKGFKNATPATKVAQLILKISNIKNPSARYAVDFSGWIFIQVAKLLPDSLKDFFFKKIML